MKDKITTIFVILVSLGVLYFALYYAIKIISTIEIQKSDGDLVNVIDGDTFILNNETIRLLCVNTPEKDQEGYEESTSYLQSLIYNKPLRLEKGESDQDTYNRSLRFVYTINDDKTENLVNKLIVDNGYGSLFPYNSTNCSRLM